MEFEYDAATLTKPITTPVGCHNSQALVRQLAHKGFPYGRTRISSIAEPTIELRTPSREREEESEEEPQPFVLRFFFIERLAQPRCVTLRCTAVAAFVHDAGGGLDTILVPLYRTLDELRALSAQLHCADAGNSLSTQDACERIRAAVAQVRIAIDAVLSAKLQQTSGAPR